MKAQQILTFLLLFIVFCLGCNKKEEPSCTNYQLPGAYFPAYPKTWWNYRNIDNKLVQYKISDDYYTCEGKCRPIFININKCIQGSDLLYRFYAGLGASGLAYSSIYSTQKDTIMVCGISFSTFAYIDYAPVFSYRRKTTTVDTVLIVLNKTYQNVIVIKETNTYNLNHRYFDYFAKDIGLIRRDSVNVNDITESIPILLLENFSIGK